MTTSRLIALLGYSATLVAIAVARAGDQSDRHASVLSAPSSVRLAAEVLDSAQTFAAAHVGYAGVTPPEVLAWNIVLRSERADSVFRALLRAGGRPTQLYALSGLRFLMGINRTDPYAYWAAVRALESSRELVWETVGCVSYQSPLAELVHEVDKGTWTQEFIGGRRILEDISEGRKAASPAARGVRRSTP